MEIPRIISVDDHVIEPAHVWQDYLPAAFRDRGPRLTRVKGRLRFEPRHMAFREQEDGYWADCWSFGGMLFPVTGGFAAVSFPREAAHNRAVLFDDILPGCYDRTARLADMDRNHTDASLCFPTFPRFCGQTFLERGDRDLALACVRAYNDWMIGEWCADAARGRLIPLTLIPMWDPDLAAQEVRRCAAKGSHAIAFSENPAALGLPSVHTDAWDPLWAACEDTDTVVNMHIGSSSTFSKTSDDAPPLVIIALTFEGASHALVDWLTSGVLARFSSLRIALSEGQVGWMPFLLERLDEAWEHARGYAKTQEKVPEPPSTLRPGPGLRLRLRRPGGPGAAGPHRHGPDHVRDRLPARRLHVPALQGHRRHDRVQSRPVGAGNLAAAARQRDLLLPAGPLRHHGVTQPKRRYVSARTVEVTPARLAISRVPTSSYPRSSNSSRAARRTSDRTVAELRRDEGPWESVIRSSWRRVGP